MIILMFNLLNNLTMIWLYVILDVVKIYNKDQYNIKKIINNLVVKLNWYVMNL
jgi:hypothetical protein